MLYVTYGFGTTKDFDINKIEINLNECIGKPKSAWWGSPVSAEYGWKEWCEANDFVPGSKGKNIEEYFDEKDAIYWKLETGSKILMIDYVDDLIDFFEQGFIEYIEDDRDPILNQFRWNFYNVVAAGYDAIQLNDSTIGHNFRSDLEMLMNSWDCESIVVLNPSKIIVQRC